MGPLLAAVDDEELANLIGFAPNVPWETWSENDGRIAATLAQVSASRQRRQQLPSADAPIAEILRAGFATLPEALIHRFRRSLTTTEVEFLRQAARDAPDPGSRRVALRALAERVDISALDVAEGIFERNTKGGHRAAAIRYLEAIPPTVTLPLARDWLDLEDDRSGVAADLLALHSEAEDVEAIRRALARSWPERLELGWMYTLCSLVDALGRHPEHGPYTELVAIFESVEYSYVRRKAASALHRCNEDLSDSFGRECLWDCEAETRALGAVAAPETPAVGRRLHEFSRDEHEYNDVRSAAQNRLRRSPTLRSTS